MVEGFDVLSHVGIRVVRCMFSDVWRGGLCFSVEMGLTNFSTWDSSRNSANNYKALEDYQFMFPL